MKRSFESRRNRIAATALLLALSGTGALAASKSSCTPSTAGGEVVSQSANGLSLSLDASHLVALANWDVRWWQRRRVWIALDETNRGDAAAQLLANMVVDAHKDGSASITQVGTPLLLAPHAHTVQHLAIYIPDTAKTLGVRMLGAALADKVDVAISLECSDDRFEPGEMAKSVVPLFDEALKLYFGEFVDPLSNPRASLEMMRKLASGAQESGDVVWALRGVMQSVGDVHSFALLPGETPPVRRVLATRAPEFELRTDGVAVVRLHAVDTTSDAAALAWATTLHDGIAGLAAHHPRAWVVDLRDHDGDSPWPSFAALSTLLDGPAVGAFVGRHDTQDWIVDRGVARVAGGPALVDVQAPPEPSFHGQVAVLIGPGTRDAGEEVAVAFHGRPHTRFFGAPTAGFPLLNVNVHRLSDGTLVGVLETRAADRTGVVHRVAVEPDTTLSPEALRDALPQQALDWVFDEHATGTLDP